MNILRSSLLGPLELRRCPHAPDTCPLRSPQPAESARHDGWLRCMAIGRPAQAADWLRTAASHADDIALLRRIVSEDARPVAWLSDQLVIEQVAERVARRDFCLVGLERWSSGEPIPIAEPPPVFSPGVTPSMLEPRLEVPEVAPEIPELTMDVDQALQAAVLEAAALDGVPFCEECEKARQQAAKGAA